MAAKASPKAKLLNTFYSLGAAVVILGALCKMIHFSPLGIDSNVILASGLITEAIIFIVYAFFSPPDGEYQWEKVYPELVKEEEGENKQSDRRPVMQKVQSDSDLNISLSGKLDEMLSEAKLDVTLLEKLRGGIENFGVAVEGINKTVDASVATEKYKEQLQLASSHMENLNALYQLQLENGKKYSEANQKFIDDITKASENSEIVQQQLAELTLNINNLNKVYGGMLNAMKA